MPEPRKLSVFLCHASQDKPIVRELNKRLLAEGWIDPWLDEEKIPIGAHWESTIDAAIEEADCVILFLSTSSVTKESFLQREMNHVWELSLEKPEDVLYSLPLRLDDCQVPRRLRQRQWGDYFGATQERTYKALLKSLEQRHQQRLRQEADEQAREQSRVEKLALENKQQVAQLREAADEVLVKQAEERARREEEEKNRIREELVRKAAEAQEKVTSGNQAESTTAFSRYTGSSLLIDEKIVHFESLGRGRPVIFLHGWVGSWRYWFRSMQVASRSFRSYALDLWGYGDTAHNPLSYSLEQQAQLLERFLQEMGIGKIALVGHGLGALVGMTFAARFPQSVDRLMAVSCPLDYQAVNPRLRTTPPYELIDWLSTRTPETMTALADASKADPKAIVASLIGLQANNIYSHFRNLNIPCLLVYGDRDPAIVPPDGEYSLSTMIHQIGFEASGHFPMLDEPALFDRLLLAFLGLNSGISPREISLGNRN